MKFSWAKEVKNWVLEKFQIAFNFFHYHIPLGISLICSLLLLIATIILSAVTEKSFWSAFFASLAMVATINIFYYIDAISKTVIKFLANRDERKVSTLLNILLWGVLGFLFYNGGRLAKMCFSEAPAKEVEWFYFGSYLLLIVFSLGMVAVHTKDLAKIWQDNHSISYRVQIFLFTIIHIIQMFTNVYVLLLLLNPDSLSISVMPENAATLYFELFYFSATTFLAIGCDITPVSIPAKVIVLVESFLYAIVISVLIFTFLDRGKNAQKTV